MAKLILKAGTPLAQEFELKPGKNFIGRAFANDFKLDDASVSGSHAVVTVNGGIVTVTDLGSTNGTRINQLPATGSPLQSGHVVKLGAVELLFVGDAASATMPPSIASLPPVSAAAAQIATEFIIRQPSHVGVASAPAPAPVPQAGSVSIPRPITSTPPPPAPIPQSASPSMPQPVASAPPAPPSPIQNIQISIPRPLAAAPPPASVQPMAIPSTLSAPAPAPAAPVPILIPSAAPKPPTPAPMQSALTPSAPPAPVPIIIPASTVVKPPTPALVAPAAPAPPPPVPIMATSAAEAPLPPGGGGLKLSHISHAPPAPVMSAPTPAAAPAMQATSAAPVAAGLMDAPPGKVSCKFHRNTSGEWLCQKCNELFCSLCVSNRPTAAGIAYFCRTCGDQCAQVKIKMVAKKEKKITNYSDGTIILRTVGFGLGGALVAAALWAGSAYLMGTDVPFLATIIVGAICGFAVKIASQDRPGALFSGMAVVATLIGSVLGKVGAAYATNIHIYTGTVLLTGLLGLLAGLFLAWKIGGGDF